MSLATRGRVLAVAEVLGYRPSAVNQLPLRTYRTVGLVTHDLEGRFSIPILMGAEDAFGLGNVSVMLCDARGDSIRERYHVDALIQRQVDGLIIVGARPDPRPSLGRTAVPIIYAYAPSVDAMECSVVADHRRAGRIAVEHLITCGRRRIAIVAGDASYGAAAERVAGALEVLHENGLSPVGDGAAFGAWSEGWGRAAARSLLKTYPGIDGILCGSDQVARGVLDTLRQLGKGVPRDIAVVGNDNWAVLAEESQPTLTTVDMNLEEVGRRAAALLLDSIRGVRVPGPHIVEPHIVVRESAAL